jgi:hypothetical protein
MQNDRDKTVLQTETPRGTRGGTVGLLGRSWLIAQFRFTSFDSAPSDRHPCDSHRLIFGYNREVARAHEVEVQVDDQGKTEG